MIPPEKVRIVKHKSNAAYHAADGFSRSQLATALDSAAEFYGQHVAKTIPRKVTKPMEMGTLAHDAIVNRSGGIMSGVKRIAASVLTSDGRRAGKAWQEYKKKHADKMLVNDSEYTFLKGVAFAVRESGAARRIINRSKKETAIHWTQPVEIDGKIFKLKLRCQIDLLTDVLAEFKTARRVDPAFFAREILERNYHFQGAVYQWAYEGLTGDRLAVEIIAARNSEPFEGGCEVYKLNDEYMALGFELFDLATRRVARCLLTKTWRSKTHGQVVTLAPPNYGRYQTEYLDA